MAVKKATVRQPGATDAELEPPPGAIPGLLAPQARLSLDHPPEAMAHLARGQQKRLIARANALQADGLTVAEAIERVISESRL